MIDDLMLFYGALAKFN